MPPRLSTHVAAFTLLLLGSLSTSGLAMDPKSLEELKLLRQWELASEGASACLHILHYQAAPTNAPSLPLKAQYLRYSIAGREYMRQVTLVARHVNGGAYPYQFVGGGS